MRLVRPLTDGTSTLARGQRRAIARVGCVGLGHIGRYSATKLLAASCQVTVHDLDKETARSLLAVGASWSASPKEVASQSDLVITCLPSVAATTSVVAGVDGLLHGFERGGTWIDMSTNDMRETQRLAELLWGRGVSRG